MNTAVIVIMNIVLDLAIVTAIVGLLAGSIASEPANRGVTWLRRARRPQFERARSRSMRGRVARAWPGA